jgi:hypothetical protein
MREMHAMWRGSDPCEKKRRRQRHLLPAIMFRDHEAVLRVEVL